MSGSECVHFIGNPLFLLQPHDKEVTVVTCLQNIWYKSLEIWN